MKSDTISTKIRKTRFEILTDHVARTIRKSYEAGEIASVFGLEGPLRASIRANLCRQGVRWQDADDTARQVLASAFRTLRASRPDWDEGQPEWAIHAGTLIERTLCIRCKTPLPAGHYKFCGDLCASAHFHMMEKRKLATEQDAYDNVVKFNGKKYVA